jgi:hypothetical protein
MELVKHLLGFCGDSHPNVWSILGLLGISSIGVYFSSFILKFKRLFSNNEKQTT